MFYLECKLGLLLHVLVEHATLPEHHIRRHQLAVWGEDLGQGHDNDNDTDDDDDHLGVLDAELAGRVLDGLGGAGGRAAAGGRHVTSLFCFLGVSQITLLNISLTYSSHLARRRPSEIERNWRERDGPGGGYSDKVVQYENRGEKKNENLRNLTRN